MPTFKWNWSPKIVYSVRNMPPLAVVTCGPAFEPIDEVRCLTNHSSGELGTHLCEALRDGGFEVLCLRGTMATFRQPERVKIRQFGTNSELDALLGDLPDPPQAIFHVAALCDYEFAGLDGAESARKISSSADSLTLHFRAAKKLLPTFRDRFPDALLVGWKFEADGSRGDALARGEKQMATCLTDACVVNGPAYGAGFGFLSEAPLSHVSGKAEISRFLAGWALGKLSLL